jgi:hypothetical protein
VASPTSKKFRAIYVSVAVLWLAFAAGQTLYSGLRLFAPQRTSQSYQDLLSGRRKVAFVIIVPQNVGRPLDTQSHLEAMRREALSNEVDMERSRGRHGLALWGSLLLAGALILALTWRGVRGSQVGAV